MVIPVRCIWADLIRASSLLVSADECRNIRHALDGVLSRNDDSRAGRFFRRSYPLEIAEEKSLPLRCGEIWRAA